MLYGQHDYPENEIYRKYLSLEEKEKASKFDVCAFLTKPLSAEKLNNLITCINSPELFKILKIIYIRIQSEVKISKALNAFFCNIFSRTESCS